MPKPVQALVDVDLVAQLVKELGRFGIPEDTGMTAEELEKAEERKAAVLKKGRDWLNEE